MDDGSVMDAGWMIDEWWMVDGGWWVGGREKGEQKGGRCLSRLWLETPARQIRAPSHLRPGSEGPVQCFPFMTREECQEAPLPTLETSQHPDTHWPVEP